jgi:hypothetical protein
VITPTSRQKYKAKKSCDITHPSSKGRGAAIISGIATSNFFQIRIKYQKIRVNPGKSIHDFCVIHFVLQIWLSLWYWHPVWNNTNFDAGLYDITGFF